MKGLETQTVYDRPPPAVGVLADALNISATKARAALRELVVAGYVIAPRSPSNSMLVAYLQSYGHVAKNPNTLVAAIGKARLRWAAMGEAGTAVALSTKAATAVETGAVGIGPLADEPKAIPHPAKSDSSTGGE